MNTRNNTRFGIIAAGNWIVDHVKIIDAYPAQDALANIQNEFVNNGGSPFNVLKDLSRLGAAFPLKGIGLVGNDANGKWIKQECKRCGIEASGLFSSDDAATSYTDVMSVASTGRRTFFHQRGANAFLNESHFDFSGSTEKIFHLGYLLLLDALDAIGDDGLTAAARVLHRARQAGLETCVDLVSSESPHFSATVTPSLPFVDYLFLNEFEAEKCTGITLCEAITLDALRQSAQTLFEKGVNKWVVIHFAQGVYARYKNGEEMIKGALSFPNELIVSSVGAGDALLAGTLFGIHEGWNMNESIKLGICAAASSLLHASCSEGVQRFNDCLKLEKLYEFQILEIF
jgi:sugar/nucleoside kinase (ribokinase family)